MQTRNATERDVEDFNRAKKLKVSVEKAKELLSQNELVYQASSFSDPGDDFTKLITTKGQVVGHWPGY